MKLPPCTRASLRLLPVIALMAPGFATRAEALATLPAYFQDHVIVQGLDYPMPLAFLPDGRLLTIEGKTARIRMIVQGAIASSDPVATLDSVATAGGEQGVWGLAVDPRWPSRPYLYVMYGAIDSTIRIRRLLMGGALMDSTSGNLHVQTFFTRDVIRDAPDESDEHNGGTLRFGPDSLLYASFGDDYAPCHATITSKLYGVIARMDVRKLPDSPGPPNKPLLVPPGNPFANSNSVDERLVYARGFRNPFRFSIDKPTGRLFVGDVGLLNYEELDVISTPGHDYGWPFYEGPLQYVTNECGTAAPPGLVGPSYVYDRMEYCRLPYREGCTTAIIGGIVLHSVDTPVSIPPEYNGTFIFSDYYDGFVRRLRDSLGTWVVAPPVAGQPNALEWAIGFNEVTDYAQAPDGSLYYVASSSGYEPGTGSIHRVTYRAPTLDAPRSTHPAAALTLSARPSTGTAATLRFAWSLAGDETATLRLYDIAGRSVASVPLPAGQVRGLAQLDATAALAPGIYRAALSQGNRRVTAQVVVVR